MSPPWPRSKQSLYLLGCNAQSPFESVPKLLTHYYTIFSLPSFVPFSSREHSPFLFLFLLSRHTAPALRLRHIFIPLPLSLSPKNKHHSMPKPSPSPLIGRHLPLRSLIGFSSLVTNGMFWFLTKMWDIEYFFRKVPFNQRNAPPLLIILPFTGIVATPLKGGGR